MRALEAHYAFHQAEFELWRNGAENYICTMAAILDRVLERSGGIGPYVYSCEPIPESNRFVMTAEELGY